MSVYIPRYWKIFLSLIILFFLTPFMEESLDIYLLFAFCLLFIFGTVIERIMKSRIILVISILSGGTAIATSFIWAIPGLSTEQIQIGFNICAYSYSVFILIAIASLSHSVFVTDDYTQDRIVGSICVYLLIGFFFAFIYSAMDLETGIGFKIGDFYNYVYFSFITLTTTGFGDIVPRHGITKMIASLEAITGSIYLAVVVARLVGLHIASKRKSHS